MKRALEILQSSDVPGAVSFELSSPNRFEFLEGLRIEAVRAYRKSLTPSPTADLVFTLADTESLLMQKQFERIDEALISALVKEGAKAEYDNYEWIPGRDLPADPNSLRDPGVFYRYSVMRFYRKQFDVAMAHGDKRGCWALVCYDLLDVIDGKRVLMVDQAPQSVQYHPSTDYLNGLGLPALQRMEAIWETVKADALKRIGTSNLLAGGRGWGGVATTVLGYIAKLAEDYYDVVKSREDAERARLERERAQEQLERDRAAARQQQKEREMNDAVDRLRGREIPDGSGQMDLFEHNRERIGGMC